MTSTGSGNNRSIFRPSALERYAHRREQAALLRLAPPRILPYVLALLGLLIVSGLGAWFSQIPIYASGLAAVRQPLDADDVVVIAFLPPETLAQLRVGQTLWLQVDSTGQRLAVPILHVEPAVVGPAKARQRFDLGAAALALTQPSAVVSARFDATLLDASPATLAGSIYPIKVEIGSRRILTLLPGIGPLFEESSNGHD